MTKRARKIPDLFSLRDKTREEVERALDDRDRSALIDIIQSLISFDRWLTAHQIADSSQVPKREVLEDMKAGRFHDPIFGDGFFRRSGNSFRVSTAAANEWRRSFFVAIERRPRIPGGRLVAITRRKTARRPREMDLTGKSAGQKAPASGGSTRPPGESNGAQEAGS